MLLTLRPSTRLFPPATGVSLLSPEDTRKKKNQLEGEGERGADLGLLQHHWGEGKTGGRT